VVLHFLPLHHRPEPLLMLLASKHCDNANLLYDCVVLVA